MKLKCSICKTYYFFKLLKPKAACPVCQLTKRVERLEKILNLEVPANPDNQKKLKVISPNFSHAAGYQPKGKLDISRPPRQE